MLLTLHRSDDQRADVADVIDRIAVAEMLTDHNIERLEAVDAVLGACEGKVARECVIAFVDQCSDLGKASASVFGRNDPFGRSVVRQATEAAVAHAG